MNKESKQFLQDLQHEMLTQDTVGQADPRFWVVTQIEKVYGVENDADGYEIMYNGEETPEDLEGLYELLLEIIENKGLEFNTQLTEDCIKFEGYRKMTNIIEVYEFIKYDLHEYCNVELIPYINERKIVPNTMFLTLRECEEHIKKNYYHYNQPKSYAMTAWRSPQVEKLYKILKETDWENYCVKEKYNMKNQLESYDNFNLIELIDEVKIRIEEPFRVDNIVHGAMIVGKDYSGTCRELREFLKDDERR